MLNGVNLQSEFEKLDDYWSPRIVGTVNDQYVKLAKVKGELCWHKHDNEDELFQIIKGELVMEMEQGSVTLREGEFFVVPKGVMHNPVAADECWILLIETVTTSHTGDEVTEKTRSISEQLGESLTEE